MKRLVPLCVFGCLLLFAPAASANIYWASGIGTNYNTYIGSASLDGISEFHPELIPPSRSFYGGVATDGTHLYLGETDETGLVGTMGRATVGGGSVERGIANYGKNWIFSMEATPSSITWITGPTNFNYTYSVVRGPNPPDGSSTVLATGETLCDFDTDANYVYWSEGHAIGRAPLGNPGAAEHEWIKLGEVEPCGIAVDSGHIYWNEFTQYDPEANEEFGGTHIGRANLSGQDIEPAFLSGFCQAIYCDIDEQGGYLYWTNQPEHPSEDLTGSIGRASVDGTGVAQFFIRNIQYPLYVDLDPGGAPPAPPGSQGQGPPPAAPHLEISIYAPNGGGYTFRPRRRGISTVVRGNARAAAAVPSSIDFSYTLSEAATVKIEIQQLKAGRLAGKKCKKPTKANATKKKCDLTAQTLFRTSSAAGEHKVPYNGRVKGKTLKPGKYKAVFTASTAAGTSKPASVGLTVLGP
jgi:hypothetical protein